MNKAARHPDPALAIEQPLAIGEKWWIRIKGSEQVRKVEIADLHERFVALRHVACGGRLADSSWLGWFERRRIKWLELVRRKTA